MSGNTTEIGYADYWSTQQAADYLGMPVRTVRNYVLRGELPAVRIGGLLRIHPADVRAFAKPVEPVR